MTLSHQLQPVSTQVISSVGQIVFSPTLHQLASDQKELVQISVLLFQQEARTGIRFSDYSFVVFPMAKAYEGFLKEYLLKGRFISWEQFHDHHFRIGRAINPDVRPAHRDASWLFDDLERNCSPELARLVWETWLQCRNQVFHYFPSQVKRLSLNRAGEYLLTIHSTMTQTLACRVANSI